MSLKYGLVEQDTFDKMLEAALREYPNSEIIVKTHPDVRYADPGYSAHIGTFIPVAN